MSERDSLGSHSSTGHRLSNASFIDAHYAVCQKSYEAMLRAVGLQPGWHVLDAGCGSGSFLPLMAELIGSHGRIDAFDLAPENIARVNTLVQESVVPIMTQIGSLTNLPYADNTFDAIWNANVTQYLTDDALIRMLEEFVRVVKPGGLVAIKESDATMIQNYPFDPFVYARFVERQSQVGIDWRRVLNLPHYLTNAGLRAVRQQTFVEEIRAPLPDHVYAFMGGALQFFAKEAEALALSDSDMEQWRRCRDTNALDNPINHPDYYFREGMTLVVGTKAAARE